MKKKDLKIGKWYIYNVNWYIKFKNLEDDTVWCSQHIDDDGYYKNYGGTCGNYRFLKPISISEIAHLLPKDHPDLQNIERSYELW